jgi:hypothetical protein
MGLSVNVRQNIVVPHRTNGQKYKFYTYSSTFCFGCQAEMQRILEIISVLFCSHTSRFARVIWAFLQVGKRAGNIQRGALSTEDLFVAKAKKPTVTQQRAPKLVELKEIIRGRLARFWPRRAEQLRLITSQAPPTGITHVRFEIFDADTTLTVWVYAIGAEGDADVSDPFGELMSDLRFPRYDAISWDAYRRAIGRKAEPVIEEVLIEELRRLWTEVGGASYPVPVVIRWHDSSPAYDLLTGKRARAEYY